MMHSVAHQYHHEPTIALVYEHGMRAATEQTDATGGVDRDVGDIGMVVAGG